MNKMYYYLAAEKGAVPHLELRLEPNEPRCRFYSRDEVYDYVSELLQLADRLLPDTKRGSLKW